jgi:O-antigen ligase
MSQYAVKLIQQRLLGYGVFIAALFIIAIYLSTSLAIIFSGLLGLLWLLTAQYQKLPRVLKDSPVAAWALLLYLCYIVGLSYGDVPSEDGFSMLRKYRELFFIPLLSCFFTNERYRLWAWKAFIIASVLTLLGSYLMDFGIMDILRHKAFTLKSRITHSIFIAFFMFFCAHKAFDNNKHAKWYLVLLLLGIYNLFFLVDGRTGQLIFMVLAPLFAIQRFGKKGLLVSLSLLIIFLSLYFSFSDKSARIHEGLDNTQAYINHQPQKKRMSMLIRYTFWENSLKLVSEKPWLGHGTGSFAQDYQRVTGAKHSNVKNPHNEFLLIGVQFGLLGLVIYSGFLFSQYSCARALPDPERWLAQGLLLTLIITSLFNSPFLDHTEGHWFAAMIALCFAPNIKLSKQEAQRVST